MKTFSSIRFIPIAIFSIALIFLTTCDREERNNPWDSYNTLNPNDWSPINLEIVLNSLSSVTLTWQQTIDHIEGFKIDRKVNDEPWEENIATLGFDQMVFTDIINELEKTYSYRVYAYAGNNKSAYTETSISLFLPTVITTNISEISGISATGGGNIVSDGGTPITSRGLVWSTSQNPTITNNQGITYNETGSETFISTLSNLQPGTVYYVKAYATNYIGTSLGAQQTFTTLTDGIMSTVTYNNYTYKTVLIDNKEWFAENLRTTKFRDGSNIPNVGLGDWQWTGLSTPAYCWYDDDQSTNEDTYGALYNWYAVNTGNLCPTGWHVPTRDEWYALRDYPGDVYVAARKLKATSGWNTDEGNGTDEYNFSALPGGGRSGTYGHFYLGGTYGIWWSSTPYDATKSYYFGIASEVFGSDSEIRNGLSVRCIKD